MLIFPWRTLAEVIPSASYVALLGVVRISGIRLLPSFLRFGFQIEPQLRRTPGVVGYRTAAQPTRLCWYHLSVWIDSAAIRQFVGTAPHVTAMVHYGDRLGETVFRYWAVTGADLPLHFRRELHRL